MKKKIGLEFFAGTQKITQAFNDKGGVCYSLDIKQLHKERKIDFLVNFFEFDYTMFANDEIDFLYFGLPCNCFSLASGGKHFVKNEVLSIEGINAYLLFVRMTEIINYFSNAIFFIENPSGAICSRKFFKEWCLESNYFVYTFSQKIFGTITDKKTNLITNSTSLMLFEKKYRVKGKITSIPLANLSLKKRQGYTKEYADFIIDNYCKNINN